MMMMMMMTKSAPKLVLYGVPQGWVGPWADPVPAIHGGLVQLIERHDLSPHLYTDDTQVYGSCRPSTTAQLLGRMSACLADVAAWMCSNRLQLNTAKTEVIWCSSTRRQHQIPQCPLVVGSDAVVPVRVVRDLGIYLDSDLMMRTHVAKTVSSCLVVLRQLRSIRRSVSDPVL